MSDDRNHAPSAPGDALEELSIYRAALEVHRVLEPSAIGDRVVSAACALSGAIGGFLYVRSVAAKEYHLLGCHSQGGDPRKKGLLHIPLDEILKKSGFQRGRSESGKCPEVFSSFGFQSVDVIFQAGAEHTYYLLLAWDRKRPGEVLEPLEREPGVRLLAECVTALENGFSMEQIRELVIKDDQTESFNRRYLDSFLVEELERARRYGTSLSLIFMDLDNLKAVNSLHGHSAGSRALREVTARVQTAIRGSDKLFRYGGDEFCVVLPETDTMGAFELAERLRQTIVARPFPVEEQTEMPLSASFGVSSFPLHAETAAELINRADEALTKVKKSGKNSIGMGTGLQKRSKAG